MKGLKCRCGRTARPAKLSFQGQAIDGWKCRCGEEYFDPVQAERILALNKLKHQVFQLKLGEIRSNLILRIPKAIQVALGLMKGEQVVVKLAGARKLEIET